jgi:cellulose synthase/poly-beta-1,6-N-acetylglucosamine synthase-like glycosyltransferase
MIELLDIGLLIIAIIWLIPSFVLLIECFSAVFLQKISNNFLKNRPLASFKILIPAHNEAAVISTTLDSLLTQVESPSQILVVADNCTDNTADIARHHQVEVLERHDSDRRGKGFALDFGVNALRDNPPDIVIFMDADCLVEPGAIAALVREAQSQQKPIQALYLLEKPKHATPKDTISALAFLVKNQVRPAGLAVWNLPCLLTGTGMAFPWQIIQKATLASDNLVEDIQLGLDLAIAGHPPQFCEQAKITGILPQQEQAATSQRTRWEHGYLQTLLRQCPRLVRNALQQKRFDLLALAADISVVPLSLWVLIWLGGLTLSLVGWALGTSLTPVILLAIAGVCFAIAVISAWAKFGREEIPAKTLLAVPFYVLWKIPLYFAFLINRQSQWVRTERDIS